MNNHFISKNAFFFVVLLFIVLLTGCNRKDEADYNLYQKYLLDIEDNDKKSSPNEISTQNPVVGFFNNKGNIGDTDFYRVFFAQKQTSYKIILTAVPGIDSKLSLYNSTGKLLFIIDENGTGEGEKMWDYYPTSGNILIAVESKTGYNEKIPYYLNFIPKHKNSIEEIEPNNTEETAIQIELDETKRGLISPKNDIDYYKIIFKEQSNYDFLIKVEPLSEIDTFFTIYDKTNNIQKLINNYSWGVSESFSYLSSKKGDYFIRLGANIKEYDKKDPIYSISVQKIVNNQTFSETEVYYEREFNDESSLATDLIPKSNITGMFYPEGDVDWYKFDILKNNNIINISLSRIRGIDTVIEIYDKKNNLIKKIDENSIDEGEEISINNLSQDRYFFKIFAKKGYSMINYQLYYNVRY